MVNLLPFSDSFAKILPSLVQKECTLPARVPLVSSWTMPCLYRVLCDEEFFNFLLDWYTEFFYFPVLHFAYNFNISFAIWFLNGVGSWDFVFSQFNVEVILTDTHDNVICVDVSKITSRNWTILLPYCSGSMLVSSRLQIWFWRSSLDFSTSKNFWDSESNFVDRFWIVSVRSLNADWIAAWIVGLLQ